MTPARPEDVLDFWLREVGAEGWYAGGDALDARVRDRFLHAWEGAMEGRLRPWLTTPQDALAYVILLDQLPRNMFRGDPRSFASTRARVGPMLPIGMPSRLLMSA